LDWHDLPASRFIMDNIVEAERQTMFGVFLLTKDDNQIEKESIQAVPRDNVVFEAGYFAGAKGPRFDLIIHESGAKLPIDLGGFVYLELKDGSDISSIETQIRDYFAEQFPEWQP
jgi:predicted nucleotide-binding protein